MKHSLIVLLVICFSFNLYSQRLFEVARIEANSLLNQSEKNLLQSIENRPTSEKIRFIKMTEE
jgi:hypothetical protein